MPDYDISLAGHDFMLLPGSYRSFPDGNLYVDSRLGRQVLSDFTTGLSGPKIDTRNQPGSSLYGEAALRAWPAPWPLGLSAIGPAPRRVATGYTLAIDEPKIVVRSADYAYIAVGEDLWRWDHVNAPELRHTFANSIVGMTLSEGLLYCSFGTAAAVASYDDATDTANTDALGGGYEANSIGSISRGVIVNSANITNEVRFYAETGSSIDFVDSPVRNMVAYDSELLIATARSIYAYTPANSAANVDFRFWGTVSSDGFQNADDYAWLVVFNGRLMAWFGGRAVIYDKQRSWWRHAGLEAAESHGAALVNGWLIVSVTQRGSGSGQLWGYNGSGWWLLDEHAAHRFPASTRGTMLVAWQAGGDEMHRYEFDSAADSAAIAGDATVDTALLDGGEPDRAKFWRRIGIELARANPDDVGEWTVELRYSTDAGATWTSAGSAVSVTTATATVSQTISTTSNYLRLRVIMTQVSGLPPFVLSAWAEYETLNDSVRRRRWQFKVAASDRVVTRDGALDPRDGQDMRDTLWRLFTDAETVDFADIDGASYDVRMIGLREEWHKPADAGKIGAHTTFDVTIVEL